MSTGAPFVPQVVTVPPILEIPPPYQTTYHSLKGTWNAGDFYWYQDTRIKLRRATDEIVIAFAPGVKPGDVLRRLTAKDGPLHEFRTREWLRPDVIDLHSEKPLGRNGFRHLRAAIASANGVAWAAPAFRTQEGYRLVITNEITVKLKDRVDPAAFFAGRVAEYQSYFFAHLATIAKGGVAALRLSNAMHVLPEVVYSQPNFYSQIILA